MRRQRFSKLDVLPPVLAKSIEHGVALRKMVARQWFDLNVGCLWYNGRSAGRGRILHNEGGSHTM